jgi:adenylate kinase family enzyme
MPADSAIGTPSTTLIVIRGNSGSGKSSIARQLQRRYGRGCALIEQDYLRRIVLRELDGPGGIAPALIEQTVRFALDNRYHAILEGILSSHKYGPMIAALRRTHRGTTHVFYLDVSFEETLRRHGTRPQATDFTAADMRRWYKPWDLLGFDDEHVVPEASSMEATIARIAATANLSLTTRDEDFVPAPHVARAMGRGLADEPAGTARSHKMGSRST